MNYPGIREASVLERFDFIKGFRSAQVEDNDCGFHALVSVVRLRS